MNDERLKILLQTAAQDRLTPAEEAELVRLLADSANRGKLDRELTPSKDRFADLHDYQQALRAKEPKIPEAKLQALLAALPKSFAPKSPPNVVSFRRWFAPVAFVGAMAACFALVFWFSGKRAAPPRVFEFGMVATIVPTRSASENFSNNLGAQWQVTPLKDLVALTNWSSAELPTTVAARIWIDEEAGKLRAVYRRSDGTIVRTETMLDSKTSVENQLKLFEAKISGNL